MSVKWIEAKPPKVKRKGTLSDAEAEAVLGLFNKMVWVGSSVTYTTRPSAAHQANRLMNLLTAFEPGSKFTSKTWEEKRRWYWAVSRLEITT